MRISIIILIVLLNWVNGFSQSISRDVSPSSGGVYSNGSGSLSWTLGETITPTLQAGSNMLTQGFQQPESQLSTGTVALVVCAGSPISVPFTANDIFPGNIFTAQLSDASGSFTAPVNIGSLSGVASGTIAATIPTGTVAGSAYRIRVISSVPALTGSDNGADIIINTAPVLACPSNITVNTDPGVCGATVNFSPVVTGSPAPAITYSHNPGSVFPVGTTTVTVTASNSCGSQTCTFDVTVNDMEAPVANCQNMTVHLDATGNASITAAQINNNSTDACGIASMTVSPSIFNCISTGSNTVTLTVTDVNGNSSTCTATVTVEDTIAPVISCNADISLNTDPGVCGAMASYSVTGNDNCSGFTIVQTAGLPSGSVFPVGTTVNQFTITDASGNSSSCSFEVTVTDMELPSFSNFPSNSSQCNPVSWTQPVALDNCPSPSVSYSFLGNTYVSNSPTVSHVFPSGTTTVTYLVTDANGNQFSQSFDVTLYEPSVAADSLSSSRDYNNICLGENITLTLHGGLLGEQANWKWFAGGCGSGTSIGTGTTITVTPTATTTYYARAEGLCNTTACASITVVVSTAAPTAIPTYNVVPAYGAPGITDVISVNPVVGATYYRWFTNNGQINGVLFNNQLSPVQTAIPQVNVTFVLPQQNYQIRVMAGNACGRSGQRNTHIRGTVAATTCINGPTEVCPQSTHTYSACAIAPVSGNTSVSYQWTLVPATAGTITGNGSQTVSVQLNNTFTNAQLCVEGVSSFGLAGTPYCITLNTAAPAPSAVTGPALACEGASGIAYDAMAVSGATGYVWTTTIPGATVTGTGTTGTVNFPNTAFSGTVCVAAQSATCGLSPATCMNVNSDAPASIGSITGPVSGVCLESNVNYSVGSGANSYTWTLPSGTTGSSTSNSINIDFLPGFISGTITVTGNFTCGTSAASLAVDGAPSVPGVASGGVTAICVTDVNTIYSVNSTGATSYTWTPTNINPSGSSGCVNPPLCSQYIVEFWLPSPGLSVVAQNSCGTSAPYVFPVGCRMTESITGQTLVYPNPTSGKISVEFTSSEKATHVIRITDLTGRLVITREVAAEKGNNLVSFDLTEQGAGMYLVHITDQNGAASVTRIAVE